MAVIEARGLGLTFETADGPVHALKGVDLTELTVNMKLLGVRSLDELDGTYLQPAPSVTVPGTSSALSLL
jgi:hypothetical protein